MDAALKAIAEPNRRRILELVSDGELSAGTIADRFEITRPAISQHLTALKQAGLIVERREGTSRLYRARRQGFAQAKWFVEGFWDNRLPRLRATDAQSQHDTVTMTQRVTVQRDLVIAAPADTIWDLLTNASQATRWMGLRATFDLVVGGSYRNEVVPGFVAVGEFIDIDPPCQLAHTWGWEPDESDEIPAGSTIVDVELVPTDANTRVRLTHYGLPSIVSAGTHSRGWGHYLPRLATAAAGRSPGPDPWTTDPERLMEGLQPPRRSPPPSHQENP